MSQVYRCARCTTSESLPPFHLHCCHTTSNAYLHLVYSQCDARTLTKRHVPRLRGDILPGRWSFPHYSLWGCCLSVAGCSDYVLGPGRQPTHRPWVCTQRSCCINTYPDAVLRWKVISRCCFNPVLVNQISRWNFVMTGLRLEFKSVRGNLRFRLGG